MKKCVHCGTETTFQRDRVPMCLPCDLRLSEQENPPSPMFRRDTFVEAPAEPPWLSA